MVVAAGLGGWAIGWIAAGAVIVVVAVLVLAITATAWKIAGVAADATRSLETARDRTASLWAIAGANRVSEHILEDAIKARAALGGDVEEAAMGRGQTPEEIFGDAPKVAQDAVESGLPSGPESDPKEGRA